jgi:7,8-dihydropterin-6-yl-methyl-4-(beta-D-ribofuranosyl)aminobenzene 5'-phosphate synthase
MAKSIELMPVDRIEITTLMDNYSDLLLPSTPVMKRFPLVDSEDKAAEPPLAGHGFSLLVETYQNREKHAVLMDAGFPTAGMQHNWRVMGFDPGAVDGVFLSHGHVDHFAALGEFLEAAGKRIPLVLHPDAFLKRALIFPDGRKVELGALPPRQALEDLGADVIVTKEPYLLTPGLASTGQVARVTPFEGRFPLAYAEVDGEWQPDDFWDDQGLVAHLKGQGLVVISGCAHAGIVNTVQQAQAISGEEGVHAVVGGFHLTGMPKEKIEATIEAIKALSPALVVATHCTGFEAQGEFARQMPDSFALNAVGTRIVLGS